MDQELVSVIIPVYNVEAYLEKCIDSVIGQTYKNLQIILVDDGSTDLSGKICDEYSTCDDRIIVIHKENGGVSSARNCGLCIMKGEFCIFIDSDDFIDFCYLEQLLIGIHASNSDLCCCGYISADNQEINRIQDYAVTNNGSKEQFIVQLFSGTGGTICSKIFRSSVIIDHGIHFREQYSFCEDQLFVLEFICNSTSFSSIDEYGYYYNRSSGTTSSISCERWKEQFLLWGYMKEILRRNGISETTVYICEQNKLTNIVIGYISTLIMSGEDLYYVLRDGFFIKCLKAIRIDNKTKLFYILPVKMKSVALIKLVYSRIITNNEKEID